jgi:hypothetical protein
MNRVRSRSSTKPLPENLANELGGGRREISSNNAGIGKLKKIVEMLYLTPIDSR